MMELIGVPVLLVVVVGGLLAWRVWSDRVHDRALAVRADVQGAVNRALDGESLLSVHVEPASALHPGRVVLTTPTGYEWLVREAWTPIVEHVPDGYEVVLKQAA